ncbi:hypothetical protein [Streptomyces canus]|uniref:hypothetical protein n=1 Tax=Streptomyces canus TaxID=58343 RepID=UPI0036E42B83
MRPDSVTRRRPLEAQHVKETVEVAGAVAMPVRTECNRWTRFKTFPRFSGCAPSSSSGPP